jgi:hypothetical protein
VRVTLHRDPWSSCPPRTGRHAQSSNTLGIRKTSRNPEIPCSRMPQTACSNSEGGTSFHRLYRAQYWECCERDRRA